MSVQNVENFQEVEIEVQKEESSYESDDSSSSTESEDNNAILEKITDCFIKSANLRAFADAKATQAQIDIEERMQTIADEQQIHDHHLEWKQAKLTRSHQKVKVGLKREELRQVRDARRRRRLLFNQKMEMRKKAMDAARKAEDDQSGVLQRNHEYRELAHTLLHQDRTRKLEEEYTHESIMREANIEFANGSQRINGDYSVRLAKLSQAMVELRNEAKILMAERRLKLTELAQAIGSKYGAPLDEEYF